MQQAVWQYGGLTNIYPAFLYAIGLQPRLDE